MRSSIYVGAVRHARSAAVEHSFAYRHVLLCIDLDELPRIFDGRWLWSFERSNLVSFRRRDYLGDADVPLADAVRARVRAELGRTVRGPVLLFTQPRLLGFAFNPVSFYFCYDGADLEAIVAEITNTPWNERHAYVLDARERSGGLIRARFEKRFHVSPFQPMDLEYAWQFSEPGADLTVRMENLARGRRVFTADMRLQRRPLNGTELARVLLMFPGLSLRSLAAIYIQALRLRLKRAPVFAHPRTNAEPATVEGQ